jgi:hypothetical protein
VELAGDDAIGNVTFVPEPNSRHFDLHLTGSFDPLVSDRHLGTFTSISSSEKKNPRGRSQRERCKGEAERLRAGGKLIA